MNPDGDAGGVSSENVTSLEGPLSPAMFDAVTTQEYVPRNATTSIIGKHVGGVGIPTTSFIVGYGPPTVFPHLMVNFVAGLLPSPGVQQNVEGFCASAIHILAKIATHKMRITIHAIR